MNIYIYIYINNTGNDKFSETDDAIRLVDFVRLSVRDWESVAPKSTILFTVVVVFPEKYNSLIAYYKL